MSQQSTRRSGSEKRRTEPKDDLQLINVIQVERLRGKNQNRRVVACFAQNSWACIPIFDDADVFPKIIQEVRNKGESAYLERGFLLEVVPEPRTPTGRHLKPRRTKRPYGKEPEPIPRAEKKAALKAILTKFGRPLGTALVIQMFGATQMALLLKEIAELVAWTREASKGFEGLKFRKPLIGRWCLPPVALQHLDAVFGAPIPSLSETLWDVYETNSRLAGVLQSASVFASIFELMMPAQYLRSGAAQTIAEARILVEHQQDPCLWAGATVRRFAADHGLALDSLDLAHLAELVGLERLVDSSKQRKARDPKKTANDRWRGRTLKIEKLQTVAVLVPEENSPGFQPEEVLDHEWISAARNR